MAWCHVRRAWGLGALLYAACEPHAAPRAPEYFPELEDAGVFDDGDDAFDDAGELGELGELGTETALPPSAEGPLYPDDLTGILLEAGASASAEGTPFVRTLLPLSQPDQVRFGLPSGTYLEDDLIFGGRVFRAEDGYFYYIGVVTIGNIGRAGGLLRVVGDQPVWQGFSEGWKFEKPPQENDQVIFNPERSPSRCEYMQLLTSPESGRLVGRILCGTKARHIYITTGEGFSAHPGKHIRLIGFNGELLYSDDTMRTRTGTLATIKRNADAAAVTEQRTGRMTARQAGGFWHVYFLGGRFYRSVLEGTQESEGELFPNTENIVAAPEVRFPADGSVCWALPDGDALCVARGRYLVSYVLRLFWDGRKPVQLWPPCPDAAACSDTVRLTIAQPFFQ